jgi:hypothetical protein
MENEANCQNSFFNWYHRVFPGGQPPCEDQADGTFCVRPAVLRGCPETTQGRRVCGVGRHRLMNFPNECFAMAMGYYFEDFTYYSGECIKRPCKSNADCEGSCQNNWCEGENEWDEIFEAHHELNLFGSTDKNQMLTLAGSLPNGEAVVYVNASIEESDCGCSYNWDPVCLKTDRLDTTFINSCLASCRKDSQFKAYRQVYWPENAVLEPGECIEPCANYACDRNSYCASHRAGHATCVPIDQAGCKDTCQANEVTLAEKVCISTWLGMNTTGWHLRNKCHAETCIGMPEDLIYQGSCLDRCYDQD